MERERIGGAPRMSRRRYLIGASGVIAAVGGCTELTTLGGASSNILGESVEHRSLVVTPTVYTTATEVTFEIADADNRLTEEAPAGATHLLTHLRVEHTGGNKRQFPMRGISSPKDRIKKYYDGERLSRPRREDYSTAFVVAGTRLPNYLQVLQENGQVSAVYSGSAEGWLINIVPEGFTPEDAEIRITWGASSTVGSNEENLEQFTWTYTTEARVDPADAQ